MRSQASPRNVFGDQVAQAGMEAVAAVVVLAPEELVAELEEPLSSKVC